MAPPYRPTYKLFFEAEDGGEVNVGNFERLDEVSDFVRRSVSSQKGIYRLYKYSRQDDAYKLYDNWSY